MKHNIQIFKNEAFGTIRTLEMNNKMWFAATDVATSLGYSNPRDAIVRHCKSKGVVIHDVGVQTGIKSDGTPAFQNVKMKFINEGNLYRLIISSQLPTAEKFESWVCDEVLPEIRKTGSYNQSGNYKVAYPYKKQINRLERLREIDRNRIEIMQNWVLSLQEERNIYYQQTKACIGTICTRNFSESENINQLGELLKAIRSEQNLSPSQVSAMAGLKQPRNILTGVEKGKEDISLSNLFKLLSALDCSIQLIRNED